MIDISLVVGLVFVVYFCVRTVWKLWQSRRSTKKHPLLTWAWSNTPWRRRPPIPPVLPHYPKPKIKEAIQDAERRAAWMASQVQADNLVTDGITGTTYAPYAIGGSTIDEYSNKTWKMFPYKWIPLVGHFVTIYPGTSIQADPTDTILRIMQKTNLPYNKVLVYDQKRLEYLNWTLLKYGVPDNRKVVLTVEELVLDSGSSSDSDSDNSDSDSDSDSNSDSDSDSNVYVEDLRL